MGVYIGNMYGNVHTCSSDGGDEDSGEEGQRDHADAISQEQNCTHT